MSRDAFFDDLRSGLEEESRSSNGRTNSRSTEPSRDVKESPANRQIDNERSQVTQHARLGQRAGREVAVGAAHRAERHVDVQPGDRLVPSARVRGRG